MDTPANELERQVEEAFNFRGDVTLTFKDGREVVGFVFNRDLAPAAAVASAPFVEVARKDAPDERFPLAEIASVALSGEDHAVPFTPGA